MNTNLEAAPGSSRFLGRDLTIMRLAVVSRNGEVHRELWATDCRWDLGVRDEAHKSTNIE